MGRTQKQPELFHVVMLHPKARIQRPDAKAFDTNNVIKADQFPSWHGQFIESKGVGTILKAAFNMRSLETIREWGEKLKRQLRPADLMALLDFMQPKVMASGVRHLCTGTTWSTNTVASATCRRSSAIPVKTMSFLLPAMPCTTRQRNAIRHAGHAIHGTGALSARSPSTPNVTPLLPSTLRKSLFSRWLRKLGDNYLDARRSRLQSPGA